MNKKKIEIGVGEIPAPGQPLDPAIKGRKHQDPVGEDEVGGHNYWENVICPHCGRVNVIQVHPDQRQHCECAYEDHTFLY